MDWNHLREDQKQPHSISNNQENENTNNRQMPQEVPPQIQQQQRIVQQRAQQQAQQQIVQAQPQAIQQQPPPPQQIQSIRMINHELEVSTIEGKTKGVREFTTELVSSTVPSNLEAVLTMILSTEAKVEVYLHQCRFGVCLKDSENPKKFSKVRNIKKYDVSGIDLDDVHHFVLIQVTKDPPASVTPSKTESTKNSAGNKWQKEQKEFDDSDDKLKDELGPFNYAQLRQKKLLHLHYRNELMNGKTLDDDMKAEILSKIGATNPTQDPIEQKQEQLSETKNVTGGTGAVDDSGSRSGLYKMIELKYMKELLQSNQPQPMPSMPYPYPYQCPPNYYGQYYNYPPNSYGPQYNYPPPPPGTYQHMQQPMTMYQPMTSQFHQQTQQIMPPMKQPQPMNQFGPMNAATYPQMLQQQNSNSIQQTIAKPMTKSKDKIVVPPVIGTEAPQKAPKLSYVSSHGTTQSVSDQRANPTLALPPINNNKNNT